MRHAFRRLVAPAVPRAVLVDVSAGLVVDVVEQGLPTDGQGLQLEGVLHLLVHGRKYVQEEPRPRFPAQLLG